VFGQIKQARGFRQFLLRGVVKMHDRVLARVEFYGLTAPTRRRVPSADSVGGFVDVSPERSLFRKLDNHLLRVADLDAAISFIEPSSVIACYWRSEKRPASLFLRPMLS
jgi:hypothetical protein